MLSSPLLLIALGAAIYFLGRPKTPSAPGTPGTPAPGGFDWKAMLFDAAKQFLLPMLAQGTQHLAKGNLPLTVLQFLLRRNMKNADTRGALSRIFDQLKNDFNAGDPRPGDPKPTGPVAGSFGYRTE